MSWQVTCLVVNDGRAIGVDIDPHATIGELQERIAEFYLAKVCRAGRFLRLFLAMLDANANKQWLALNDRDTQHLLLKHKCPQRIRDMTTRAPALDPTLSVSTALGLTDADESPWFAVHLLLEIPEHKLQLARATTFVDLWAVRGTIDGARGVKGGHASVYRAAEWHCGYYDPNLFDDASADEDGRALWYDGKDTLRMAMVFKHEGDAFGFESELRMIAFPHLLAVGKLQVHATVVPTVIKLQRPLRRIMADNYSTDAFDSPTSSLSGGSSCETGEDNKDLDIEPASDALVVDVLTDEFKFQCIESERFFGSLGKAESCPLMPSSHCHSQSRYHEYADDKNNCLALSRDMRGFLDGLNCDVFVVTVSVATVSSKPVLDNRYKVELLVRVLKDEYAPIVLGRLKEDSVAVPSGNSENSEDSLARKTCVFVEDPAVFCECLAWKCASVERLWAEYSSMEPATD